MTHRRLDAAEQGIDHTQLILHPAQGMPRPEEVIRPHQGVPLIIE